MGRSTSDSFGTAIEIDLGVARVPVAGLTDRSHWPDVLWLLRHGESAGNVARDAAERDGLDVIDIAERDMDVPLSERGEQQARAVGEWLGEQDRPPTVVVVSPYERARRTARIALDAGHIDAQVVVDDRVREREFGVLDRLTRSGITRRFPDQAELRARVGKFYHRPPSGESWCDVGLRLRSALATIRGDWAGERVMIVAHQVPLLMVRYVLEGLDENEILAVDRADPLANCSIGRYESGGDCAMARVLWNHEAPLEQAGAPVTHEPETPVAPR